MGGMGSFILFSQSYFVIKLPPPKKKERKKEEEEKKETSPCSAGSAFMLKNRTVQIVLVPYQRLRDFSFYSGGFRKVLAQKKVCVCVKQICTLLLHDSV